MLRNDYAMALTSYNHAKEIFYQATNEIDTSIKVAIWNNMAACYLKVICKHFIFYHHKILLAP